ncbi:hypothetical protein AUJ77_02920 [Candidatus Nomurabacteria bacterium CG1_02_43_90]|uniref:DUF3592 domain-containing protein n=1 Tax=Candidatus Nomurabacteria bacterium CG1_02_43_90 TaxID=1805281 RepID=A0A1J4V6T0_9BACT|nr:MAG: hypothetical protein AUJ77_02920 [Candidatus Nomurabacteria bacterium CG1_02_43_90]
MSPKSILGIAISAFFFAVFLGYIGVLIRSSDQTLLHQPTVSGKVLSINIVSRAKEAVRGSAGGTMQNYWMVAITYGYTVDDKDYVNDVLSNSVPLENVDIHSKPSASLMNYLTLYTAGKAVDVSYDPRNPQERVLEISTKDSFYFLVTDLILLIVAILALIRYLFVR